MEAPIIITSLLFTLKFSAFIVMFLLLDNSFPGSSASNFHEDETDKVALLSFKSLITEDPSRVLNSWNDSSHFCNWVGVRCSSEHRKVTALNLNNNELVGTISPRVGNLSFLEFLDLSVNSFNGEIPLGLGNLQRLRTLNLSYNSLGGKIPRGLCNCSQLRNLALFQNNLIGNVPYELGSLSELLTINLGINNLYGNIPSSLGNLTSLRALDLAYNSLCCEFPITPMSKYLKVLVLSANNLSGEFPPPLYNLSSLEMISLARNNFTGNLRNDIGYALPNLRQLFLGDNSFTGYIPKSFPNASKLEFIDFSLNSFIGRVPLNLGSLKHLMEFGVGVNNLGSGEPGDLEFITSLTNCSNLNTLGLGSNRFGGLLPVSITNLSTKLATFLLHENYIHGTIPKDISNLQSLTVLHMESNYLNGTIPESVGKLTKLAQLMLDNNQLTGKIPASFGNITQLMWLSLWNNFLEGEIPLPLGNCNKLVYFDLSLNNLNGTIPQELMSFSSLLLFNVASNSLIGPVPASVGNLSSLSLIFLSHNKFSGKIPDAIGTYLNLNMIFLEGNQFDGNIPDLSLLEGLAHLDLSNNNISGTIPVFLSSLSALVYLNLSFNNLEGEVPATGIFSNITAVDVHGNPSLCGGNPEFHLPDCYKERPQKSGTKKGLKTMHLILIILLPTSFVSLLFLMIYLVRKKFRDSPSSTSSRSLNFCPKISYQDLVKSTSGFSSENLIGSGIFGTVYKGILIPDGEMVAVKVINLQRNEASKSFMAECKAIKNICHHKLVNLITVCSSIDFQGNEFKALVYPLMSKGNINDWLHTEEEGTNGSKRLNIIQRIGIALDVASALEYLHHQCETPIIHCDLKPENILLDDDMTAHVDDFGLSRLLPKMTMTESEQQGSSLWIRGTIGYIAPEYATGAPLSIAGDVYSYGIVLLEIFTGKRPTDSFLQEKGLDLHQFVNFALLQERAVEALDDSALCKKAETWSYLTSEQIECLIHILQIGVTCSSKLPKNRMKMNQVYQELLAIKETFCTEISVDLKLNARSRSIDCAEVV